MEVLARALGERLAARGLRMATAESCTGGWIAKVLTDIPGSSKWFEGGLVVYSNAAKVHLLGVPPETLARSGAVSGEVVAALAHGALERLDAQIAVAVSGVAGPGGGSPAKPVGTVWLAWGWYSPGGTITTHGTHHLFSGDREAVRRQSVVAALQGTIAHLDDPALGA